MERHPQNLEFRNNPENFHPCINAQTCPLSMHKLVYQTGQKSKKILYLHLHQYFVYASTKTLACMCICAGSLGHSFNTQISVFLNENISSLIVRS